MKFLGGFSFSFPPVVMSYELDEDYIRVGGAVSGCMLFKIIDQNTLIGEILAVGTYVKSE